MRCTTPKYKTKAIFSHKNLVYILAQSCFDAIFEAKSRGKL